MRRVGLVAFATAALIAVAVSVAMLLAASPVKRGAPLPLHWTTASLRTVALPVRFVRTPASLLGQCRRTAHAVGYAVPCPLMIPVGLQPTPVLAGPCLHYRFQIVGTACAASGLWGGWVVGSSQLGTGGASFQHLVIQVSPNPTNYAHAVNGPIALTPAEGPIVGGSVVLHGRRMRWLFVDPAHNDGSAFMSHVVLCWTTHGHTYAIGFHAVTSKRAAAAMDVQLVRHIELVKS